MAKPITTEPANNNDMSWPSVENSSNSCPMEGNPVMKVAFASDISDITSKYASYASEVRLKALENLTSEMCKFPIQSSVYESNFFPSSFTKSEEKQSLAMSLNKIDVIRQNRLEVDRFLQNFEEYFFKDCGARNHELENVLSTFPTKDLIIKTRCTFPIRSSKNINPILKSQGQLAMKIDCSQKITGQTKFPTLVPKNKPKFPLNENLMEVTSDEHASNIKEKFNLINPSISSLLPKPESMKSSDDLVKPLRFPITKIPLKGLGSVVNYGDKRVCITKAEILSNGCVGTINTGHNNILSSTMTQSKGFFNNNDCGETNGEVYTEKQTNFKNRRNEKNEQEQLTYLQNYHDDVLATETAKNITNSGQPKSCYELPHFTGHIQNSRSTSKTQSSPKNIYDLEKNQKQQNVGKEVSSTNTRVEIIKTSPPSPLPKEQISITIESVKNTVPKEEQIISIATNAQPNISNNLYDINFEHWHQPWSTYLTHSEVRDPSSQEGLIVNDPVACESGTTTRIRTEPASPPADQSLYANEAATESTSLNYLLPSLTSSTHTNTTTEASHVQNECQSLVTNKFLSNVKSDAFAVRNVSAIYGVKEKASTESQQAAKTIVFDRRVDIAMTLTKVHEQKEADNFSVSSSQLDDIPNSSLDEGLFNEMKFEMNGAKIGSNVTTRTSGGSSQVKAESIPVASVSGSSVLSAVTDISKLANFGRSRRESGFLSRSDSSASFDAKDSVLPARTLLRRQRRLQSQCSNDKQEDPIERLNRLRARISGALSEVKVVLKHYSVDDGTETEQTPVQAYSVSTLNRPNNSSKLSDSQEIGTTQATVKDEGPVSFRFVRKVRRQSVFSEEETSQVKKATMPETIENKLAINDSSVFPKEYTKTEKISPMEVHDKILDPRNGNDKKLNGTECSALENSAATATPPDKKKFVNLEENNEAHNLELNKKFSQPEDKFIPEAVVESKLESQSTDIEVGIDEIQSSAASVSHLAALNAKRSFDESPKGVELKAVEPHVLNASTDEIKKQKKRVIKSKTNSRRASIGAVESSQIDPPVSQANNPLAIKIQRRPSDSEAIIKRKVKTSEATNNTSTKNVITAVKEKQTPVKKKATASKAEINQPNNGAKVTTSTTHIESNAITSVDKAAVKVASKKAVPISSDTLPTQLAITIGIDLPSNSAEKLDNTKTDGTQALSNSTNNSRSPTKLVDESSAMVAALASQLRTCEASSHTINAETQPLNVLTDSAKLVPSITEKAKDQDKNISEVYSRTLTITDSTDVSNQEQKAQPPIPSTCATPQESVTIEHCSEESQNLKPFDSLYKANDSAHLVTPSPAPESNAVEIIKSDPVANGCITLEQYIAEEISNQFITQPTDKSESSNKMPELQVTPVPVKPVQVFAETDTGKINYPTNKTTVKRIVRKNSIDKAVEKKKSSKSLATETGELVDREILKNDGQTSTDLVTEKSESTEDDNVPGEEITTEEVSFLEPPVAPTKPKKPRKVKKKVIIKRQHRKLSVGESTFFKEPEQPDATSTTLETLERAIAYVTDDEEEDEATEQNIDPVKPVKSCMKQREFQVGEWVMYGERFRKTQIRWKKGQITERITSISYKIKLDDKEVSAHISYIKKYTGRKVNFGGKEYLEIDYEQIEEEERRARTYSIWNMV